MAILLLPVMISIIVYINSKTTLESEIHQANNSLLKQVREIMDNSFQSMERLNFEMTWNLQVQELLYSNKYASFPNDYTYDLYRVSENFNLYNSTYLFVDLFYMYMADTNTVVLPGSVQSASYTYQTQHSNPFFSYEQWRSVLRHKDFKGFLPMMRIDVNGNIIKTAAYISTFRSDKDSPLATNVIMIDQSRILGAIQNVELFNKGRVLIVNRDNEVLFSNSAEGLPSDFPYEQLAGSSNFFYYKKGGERYEVQSIQSDRSGLKYVSMIPSSLYWQKAEHVRRLTYVSILISLLGGGLLTYIFLQKNYTPVRRLVQAFSGKANMSYGGGDNEFHFIEQAIGSTLNEMKQMMDQMKSQHQILRSNFIVRLLKGRVDSRLPVDESMTAFNITLLSDNYAVMLLYVESSAPFHDRIEGMDESEKLKLLQFIVGNVVEELADQHHHGYVTEVDQALVCLINFSHKDAEELKEDLLRIAREAQMFLNTHYHIHLTLSLSSIHSGINGISKAYVEALDAMEYKLVMGSNEILSYAELHKADLEDAENAYYFPLQVEQQLINFVKAGDFDSSRETLDGIIRRNLNRPAVSVAVARCLMLDLVSTMLKTIGEIGEGQENFLFQNPKQIERLTSCETIQDMQQQLTELLLNVCEYTSAKSQQNIQKSRQQSLKKLMDRVTAFINENFYDARLNISMIGNHFDMKPSYLSKLFKDHTGEGLLNFINKARVERAKHLLADRTKSLADVSRDAGFNELNTFIRIFKKYEGVTPGRYKEMMEEKIT